jgi:tetratricopeptide (TPR) repeat protein
MGRFALRDPELAALLAGQAGWGLLRDMELGRAAEAFGAWETPADRVGAARAWLELAALHAALDGIVLDAEAAYLDGLGPDADPAARAARGLVALRLGDRETARSAFGPSAPADAGTTARALGRAALAALDGDEEGARRLGAQVPPPGAGEEASLVQAGCFFWGLPCPENPGGPYGTAVAALGAGDAAAALEALRGAGEGAPAIFFYPLLRRACAMLAGAAVDGAGSPEAAFRRAEAWEHMGRWAAAAEDFRRAAGGAGVPDPADAAGAAGWLFSPLHGREEAGRLARVAEGAARYRAGERAEGLALWRAVLADGDPGPLVFARLAAEQAEAGAAEPLASPAAAAAEALAAVAAAQGRLPEADGARVPPALYAVRVAAVSRLGARVARAQGDRRRAADLLDGAHLKASGHRPDFINPPGYLAELAREYAAAGEYAPAVALLFSLAGQYPEARAAYESLKRLYASRTGGEAPPR